MKTTKVLETNITKTNVNEVSEILNFSSNIRVAICNANTLVRSVKDEKIRNSVNNFTVKTPDGFPVAKALSFLEKEKFPRVDGYKDFLQTISDGLETNKRHYFFGNNEATTIKMIDNLKENYPSIIISGHICPERMTADELVKKHKKDFESIDADIIWVSLGFPKQELFIDKIFTEIDININILGIGKAIDFWFDAETEEIARKEMELLSDRMLSNTVIEDWSYELQETEETGIGNISNDNAGTSKHHLFE